MTAFIPSNPLRRDFFASDSEQVARALLGKVLLHRTDAFCMAARIVETEAYLSRDDPAAHSFRGNTARTKVLFGPPGHAYVYRTRQHCCFNIAAEDVSRPGCVLIRALQPLAGIEQMKTLRPGRTMTELCNGPAKLCQALNIGMHLYGEDLTQADGLWIADSNDGERVTLQLRSGPRIGISKARDWPLRFALADNPFVSPPGGLRG